MKRVVNFSGGACSFWAAYRVIEKYGKEDVTLLFADVLIEDDDLYQFNRTAAEILGIPITRVCEDITPWQLFRREGLIGNSRFPICSVFLKRQPLDAWHRSNCLELDSTIYVGFDWTELNRLEDLRREKPAWRIEAPMTEPSLWDKCKMLSECEKLGLKIPRLYLLGFPHNNCGGTCVRAGISHFVHLYRVLPAKYAEWETEEQLTMADFAKRGIAQFTVLSDRRGGQRKPLSLRDLRLRIESGEKFPRDEWGGCGCGGATA